VDWTGDLGALRRGELPGTLPPEVLDRLRAAARLAAVRHLAAALGVPAAAVAVALQARAVLGPAERPRSQPPRGPSVSDRDQGQAPALACPNAWWRPAGSVRGGFLG
jgi:hypothetical protein